MQQFATLDALFDAICQDTATSVSEYSLDKLKKINNDIVAGWLGQTRDKTLLGPITDQSELIWRTLYLKQAIVEIRSVQDWANAVPMKRVGLPKSEQLTFVWWVYLNKVNEFQDRLWKFFQAASLRAPDAKQCKFSIPKKTFSKTFLLPIQPLIDLRNHWVYDSEPEFEELKRLSSLELFIIAYSASSGSTELVSILNKHARSVARSEKKKLAKTLFENEEKFRKLADGVVLFASSNANLHSPNANKVKS